MAVRYKIPTRPPARPHLVSARLSDDELDRLQLLLDHVRTKQRPGEQLLTRGDVIRWGLDLLAANFPEVCE